MEKVKEKRKNNNSTKKQEEKSKDKLNIDKENMKSSIEEKNTKNRLLVFKEKKVSKEVSQEIRKKIFKNLALAIFIMVYFIVLNLLYIKLNEDMLLHCVEIFAIIYILAGIVALEVSYKKDSGQLAITGIELMVLSMHSLFINHITLVLNYDFRVYLLTSSYVFAIYYVLKAIVIYTKSRRSYLANISSDISEIVKKDKPVVKEAKKRKEDDEELVENMIKDEKVKAQKDNKSDQKPKTTRKRTTKKETDKIEKNIEENNKNNEKTENVDTKVAKKINTKSNKKTKNEDKELEEKQEKAKEKTIKRK